MRTGTGAPRAGDRACRDCNVDIDITQAETGTSLDGNSSRCGGRILRQSRATLAPRHGLELAGPHDIEFIEFVPAQTVATAPRTTPP